MIAKIAKRIKIVINTSLFPNFGNRDVSFLIVKCYPFYLLIGS